MIEISPWVLPLLALLWQIMPEGAFFPFLFALLFHELGHVLAIDACGGEIRRFSVEVSGCVLEIRGLSYGKEAFCALMGPMVGLFLQAVPLPWLNFWAMLQSICNLLPLYPLDGGRFFRCLLLDVLPLDAGLFWSRMLDVGTGMFLVLGAIFLAFRGPFGILPIFAVALLLGRVYFAAFREHL